MNKRIGRPTLEVGGRGRKHNEKIEYWKNGSTTNDGRHSDSYEDGDRV